MGKGGTSEVLDRVDALADVVREGATESERLGYLTPAVVDALRDARLFHMFVQSAFDGLDLTLPESIEVIERVAAFDASTGWTLAILSSGALFTRFLAEDVNATTCGEPLGLLAGTLNPMTTRAKRVEGGYEFTGRATYLSGSAHARWMLVNAIVMDGDAPNFIDGNIDIRAGLFPIDQARNLDTWHVTGMRATGSNDYEFADVIVPVGWTFPSMRPRPPVPGGDPFQSIPLWSQIGNGLAACAVGAARNMIDRFIELAVVKVPAGVDQSRLAERTQAQIAIGEAQGLYQAARATLRETVDEIWQRGERAEPFDNDFLARSRLGSVTAVRLSAHAIDLLHDVAGMSAVAADSVLDRCWRDVHTMTQHIILSTGRFEIAGRVVMGLDPASPII